MEVLKFVALGVTSVSGAYALLNETKDKATGDLTRSGKVILILLITSSVLAIGIQSLETKNTLDKNRAAREAQSLKDAQEIEKFRQEQEQFRNIIDAAQVASGHAKDAAETSSKLAGTLQHVSSEQIEALETAWRTERPFGTWWGMVVFRHISPKDLKVSEWWKEKVVRYALDNREDLTHTEDGSEIVVEVKDKDSLYPFDEDELDPIMASVNLAFEPAGQARESLLNAHSSQLRLRFRPTHVLMDIVVSTVKREVESIDATVDYLVAREVASDEITNYVDFYGNRLVLEIPRMVAGSVELQFGYRDTLSPHYAKFEWARSQSTQDEFTNCAGPDQADLCLTKIMTEKELGKVPGTYQESFRRSFFLIKKRMQENAATSIRP